MNHTRKMVLVPYDKYQRTQKQTTKLEEADVLLGLPKRLHNRAKALLHYISVKGNISWDKNGEISVKGKSIDGSHITDLLKHALLNIPTFAPVGSTEFYDALRESNIPSSLISRRTPPGTRENKWQWQSH